MVVVVVRGIDGGRAPACVLACACVRVRVRACACVCLVALRCRVCNKEKCKGAVGRAAQGGLKAPSKSDSALRLRHVIYYYGSFIVCVLFNHPVGSPFARRRRLLFPP